MNALTRNPPAPMLRSRSGGTLYKAGAAMLRAKVQGIAPADAARAMYKDHHDLGEVIKAASNPATLTDPNWAGPAVQNIVRADLIQQITGLSAAAALMEAGTRIDLSGYASITIPGRLFNPSAAGSWVAEGQPITVRAPLLSQGPKLEPRKLGVLTGYSREMVDATAALEAFVRMAIQEGAAALLDQQMFTTNAGTAAAPAGILLGASRCRRPLRRRRGRFRATSVR